MKDLMKIDKRQIGEEKVNAVNARDLWSFLESKQDFSTWIKNRIYKYEFVESIDYIRFHKKMEANNASVIEYIIAIDMAKELSMVENNEKGKAARRYFIKCEKELKSSAKALPDFTNPAEAARAYADQWEKTEQLRIENARQSVKILADKPMVEFAKAVEGTNKTISIGTMAKLSGLMGRNTLFNRLRENKILIPFGRERNKPYQRHIDNGYFEVSETIVKRTNGDQITFTTSVTGKGQVWLMEKIKEWATE